MPVFAPHGPVYEETEFWYDTKENALLYEVCIITGRGEAEADHRRVREGGRLTDRESVHHDHYEPHGIAFEDPELDEPQRVANIDNTETPSNPAVAPNRERRATHENQIKRATYTHSKNLGSVLGREKKGDAP